MGRGGGCPPELPGGDKEIWGFIFVQRDVAAITPQSFLGEIQANWLTCFGQEISGWALLESTEGPVNLESTMAACWLQAARKLL